MEQSLKEFFAAQYLPVLLVLIALLIAVLGKSADWLVSEAVVLSERSGLPKVVIGATIVSLGTTTPEAAVSVLAALQGNPDLALGNAVGSIICDTGLVLGLACVMAPLPLHQLVNRQLWIKSGTDLLLISACWPVAAPLAAFSKGGRLPQAAGILFLVALAIYLWISVRWAKTLKDDVSLEEFEEDVKAPITYVLTKLVVAIVLVLASSRLLIPGVQDAALRIGVPPAIIAATLVAFGTSLPELVTAITAVRAGHGDLAVGNVVGADILNVLFVSGSAAAVTRGGLVASPDFFRILFPIMLVMLVTFRVGVSLSGDRLKRPFGLVLLALYGLALLLSLTTLKHG